jgi:hypothetical protein
MYIKINYILCFNKNFKLLKVYKFKDAAKLNNKPPTIDYKIFIPFNKIIGLLYIKYGLLN